MAQPVHFEGSNCVYVAEGCGDLPVLKSDTEIVSCWQLTPDEIEVLKQGDGCVYLHIVGGLQPPVMVGVYHPYLYVKREN